MTEEYQNCIAGLKQCKLIWVINIFITPGFVSATITDNKTSLQALALANDSYKYILGSYYKWSCYY